MICQNCQQNEATVNVNLQFNHFQRKLHLCSDCFQSLKHEQKIPSGLSGFSALDDLFSGFHQNGANQHEFMQRAEQNNGQRDGGFLGKFGRNITNAAKAGLIDPVIGRDEEIERVIEILNRRNKNNPVLIGEPGVGKTAIAEGLALKITEGNVPSKLLNKEVYLLDVASLVANTGIRGQFEERMQQLMAELQQRKNVLLFIDEIHLLVGAGSAEGSMDAGNILKPALARGELQLIGATTLKEYRTIEKDAALERRFQPVIVQEPSLEATIGILKGIQSKYENYHGVKYTDEAIEACVTLSHRYIQDRYLPDKAIDLLDEAGAKVNLKADVTSDEELNKRLAEIAKQKEEALREEHYELAAKLRDEEISIERRLGQDKNDQAVIEAEVIQSIIEKKTGIPVGKLQENEAVKMKHLGNHLGKKVIGQKEAVEKIAKAIRRSRAGLKAKKRPIGSFLFVGPTGVGKTELSKTLAEQLFGTQEAMIRLDMSEYMEKHAVSKLIGSPPGYVGHEEAGQLTEKVRRNPYSIILLDEIEKAHPDVQHIFLQILEDGRLTDSQGRTVSFRDTVIIMTSNAGVEVKTITVGFGAKEQDQQRSLLESLSQFFKPEFLNRFDAIIEFNRLEKDSLLKIVDLMLEELQHTLNEREITLNISQEVKEKLVELGYNPAFGARPLRRVIEEQLEDRLTDLILDTHDVRAIDIMLVNGEITVKKQS